MEWYYVANGQQTGPVTEAQLDELIRNGTVQASTLVWRAGLPEWQPLSVARPGAPAAPPPLRTVSTPAPGMVAGAIAAGATAPCAECQRVFPQSEMVFLNRSWVCAQCKPIFVQRMKEGVGPAGSQLWRLKKQLVCRPETVLPERCVKCNSPTQGRLKRRLYWHPPLVYLLILINLLVYAIVAIIVRKRARLEIGLCEAHRKRRILIIAVSWLTVLLGIVFVIYGVGNNQGGLAALGVLAILVAAVVGAILGPQVAAAKIDKDYVWLKGVCPEYLESLPEWGGPN
jgi:hypothetical protein